MTSACAADLGGFADVDASAWYADAVRYVSEKNLMVGTGGNQFSPGETFTRAQVATVLYRMAGSPEASGEDGFTDPDAGYAFWLGSAATRAAVAVMPANFDRLRTGAGEETMIQLKVNDTELTVQWEDNESVDALKELLELP